MMPRTRLVCWVPLGLTASGLLSAVWRPAVEPQERGLVRFADRAERQERREVLDLERWCESWPIQFEELVD